MIDFSNQINDLIDSAGFLLSNIKPSDWAEQNRSMTSDVSPFPGPFRFKRSPYLKEVLDTLSPNHPAHTIVIQKGAQVGFSTGVIENAIGYIISQTPGNILFLTGHSDLADEAMSGKIDNMIDQCGLRPLIRPNVLRKKNQRTGDTNKSKEFPGGSLVAGSAGNHKLLRQRSVRFGFIDDFDAARHSTKESGDTYDMIEQRFAAYADKCKKYYISTPEVKQTSNIEPLYLSGDQRRYHVPCPCCGDYIILEWKVQVDGNIYGITYELDENNELISESVGYTCQSCGGFFTDRHKYDMIVSGEWRPTAKPSQEGFYSYHISSLYAPPGMYDWDHYVRQYLKANPPNGEQNSKQMQTFVNLVLGHTWEEKGEAPKANSLQKNIRNYQIGDIPELLSIEDGNGKIVLITCACDLNGKVDDARLDYEIVAWSENLSSYSIAHGSIGTFIPNESKKKVKKDREHWTYVHGHKNSVWGEFTNVISQIFETDTSRKMKISVTGIDTGHYTKYAYAYIDYCQNRGLKVVGLKGKDTDKKRRLNVDTPIFRPAKERKDLYLVEVNQIKDDLAQTMKMKWLQGSGVDQPRGFMNFPIPSNGKYTFKDYFEHFESENRIVEQKDGMNVQFRWVKKSSIAQNHLWDCKIYNMALREIVASWVCKEAGLKSTSWDSFCDIVIK